MSTFTGSLALSVFRKSAPPCTQQGQHIVIKHFDSIASEFHIRIFQADHSLAARRYASCLKEAEAARALVRIAAEPGYSVGTYFWFCTLLSSPDFPFRDAAEPGYSGGNYFWFRTLLSSPDFPFRDAAEPARACRRCVRTDGRRGSVTWWVRVRSQEGFE